MQVEGVVGVMNLSQNTADWFGRSPEYGMGRRPCKNLAVDILVGLLLALCSGHPAHNLLCLFCRQHHSRRNLRSSLRYANTLGLLRFALQCQMPSCILTYHTCGHSPTYANRSDYHCSSYGATCKSRPVARHPVSKRHNFCSISDHVCLAMPEQKMWQMEHHPISKPYMRACLMQIEPSSGLLHKIGNLVQKNNRTN